MKNKSQNSNEVPTATKNVLKSLKGLCYEDIEYVLKAVMEEIRIKSIFN